MLREKPERINIDKAIFTSDFKLIVFLRFEQRVGEAVPRQLLADLRQQVVGNQPNSPQQSV